MEIRATIQTRASWFSMYVIAVLLCGALLVGGAGSFHFLSMQSSEGPRATTENSTTDPVTGFPSGSAENRLMRSLLRQSGYEGGATVARLVCPPTGRPTGSDEDQNVRALLAPARYEGADPSPPRRWRNGDHP